jgi:tetratricopeptide (TPR) repeat protein
MFAALMEGTLQILSFLDDPEKKPPRPVWTQVGASACYEPRIEPGPPLPVLDAQGSPLPQGPEAHAWAQEMVDSEPTLLTLAEQIGGPRRARAFMDLALSHFILGNLDKGRDLTERAISLWSELGDGTMEVECLVRAARFHMAAADHERAAAYYERASVHPGPALQPTGRYNVAQNAAGIYLYLQRFDRAEKVLSTAVTAARALGERPLLMALTALLTCQHRTARFTEAAAAGEEAMTLAQKLGDLDMQDNVRAMLAAVYEDSGQPARAAALQEAMVERGRADGAPRTVMIERLVHAADAHMRAGDFRSAAALFAQALPLIQVQGSQDLLDVVASNLAFSTVRSGDLEGGKARFEEAARLCSEEHRPLLRMAQGDALKEAGDSRAAAAAYREALAAFRQRGDKQRIGELLQRLGDAVAGSDRAEALRLYREWLRDHAEGQQQDWVWGMLQRAGLLANFLQGGDAAMPYFKRMKAIADSLGNVGMQATSLHRQALAYARKGDAKSARGLMMKAQAMFQAAGLRREAQAIAVELASLQAMTRFSR